MESIPLVQDVLLAGLRESSLGFQATLLAPSTASSESITNLAIRVGGIDSVGRQRRKGRADITLAGSAVGGSATLDDSCNGAVDKCSFTAFILRSESGLLPKSFKLLSQSFSIRRVISIKLSLDGAVELLYEDFGQDRDELREVVVVDILIVQKDLGVIVGVAGVGGRIVVNGIKAVHKIIDQACAFTSRRSSSGQDSRVDLVSDGRIVCSDIDGQSRYSQRLDVECQISRQNSSILVGNSDITFLQGIKRALRLGRTGYRCSSEARIACQLALSEGYD